MEDKNKKEGPSYSTEPYAYFDNPSNKMGAIEDLDRRLKILEFIARDQRIVCNAKDLDENLYEWAKKKVEEKENESKI